MKKKILAILIACMMMICCFSACDLTSTDSEKDMSQSVAEVDISKSQDFQAADGIYKDYKDVISPMSVTKRELVAYFVNSGYQYISSGMSYEDTFEILMDSMVRYKIILQYSMVYFFEESKDADSEFYGVYKVEDYNNFVKSAKDDTERMELTLKYFLDNDTVDALDDYAGYTRYDKAVYNLKQSINSAIDSQENNYIVSTDATHDHTDEGEARTTPTGINTANADFFDSDYQIYTGLNAANDCGTYEKVDGSTLTTRKQAYNAFLSMLASNYLLTKEELAVATSTEAGKGVEGLAYYKSELLTQLQSALSEKLSDAFENKAASGISAEYIANRYNTLLGEQKTAYDKDASAYETALGSMSNTNFVLYTPENLAGDSTKYGFVYNILLPFSTQQSGTLKEAQNDKGLTKAELYQKRADILADVKGADLRGNWFNGDSDYSYKATGTAGTDYYGNSEYLFFEDSFTKAGEGKEYDVVSNYYGKYAYNGNVEYNAEKDSYKLTPNKLSITDFLTEMESYMNFALAQKGYANTASALNSISYNNKSFTLTNGVNNDYMANIVDGKGEIDYSSFVYYVGQVSGLTTKLNGLLVDDNASYTALSAFNELMFAYSTDTGCLNKTYGYSANRFKTEYVGEFEYAAKLAIANGAGTYTVCPSDYGWHIIYCTYAFDQGDVYGNIDWTQFETDGVIDEDKMTKNSFEYFFYEATKSGLTSSYETTLQSKITNVYNTEDCVTIYEERYSDYTKLENTMKPEDSQAGATQGQGVTTTGA